LLLGAAELELAAIELLLGATPLLLSAIFAPLLLTSATLLLLGGCDTSKGQLLPSAASSEQAVKGPSTQICSAI
jgi:hypothetical protein